VAGVAHVPSPRQNVVPEALVPLPRFVTGRFPVTPAARLTWPQVSAPEAAMAVAYLFAAQPAGIAASAVAVAALPVTSLGCVQESVPAASMPVATVGRVQEFGVIVVPLPPPEYPDNIAGHAALIPRIRNASTKQITAAMARPTCSGFIFRRNIAPWTPRQMPGRTTAAHGHCRQT